MTGLPLPKQGKNRHGCAKIATACLAPVSPLLVPSYLAPVMEGIGGVRREEGGAEQHWRDKVRHTLRLFRH